MMDLYLLTSFNVNSILRKSTDRNPHTSQNSIQYYNEDNSSAFHNLRHEILVSDRLCIVTKYPLRVYIFIPHLFLSLPTLFNLEVNLDFRDIVFLSLVALIAFNTVDVI
jgi:hypothetical protein